MKNFEELTTEELSILKFEEVEKYVKLACAEQGIPMLPDMPDYPIKPDIQPDLKFYEIDDHYYKTQEEALEVSNVLNKFVSYVTEYSYKYDNHYRFTKYYKSQQFTITAQIGYSEELWNKFELEIKKYNSLLEQFEKIKNLYKEIYRQHRDISEPIFEKWNKATEWKQKKENLIKIFNIYLSLAENNFEIAYKFLVKANPNMETDYPKIENELGLLHCNNIKE
jgi:hypothetical protein